MRIGNWFLLPAIASLVVAAAAFTGCVGSDCRTSIGAMIASMIHTGMNFVGADVSSQQIVAGIVLNIAVRMRIDPSYVSIIK